MQELKEILEKIERPKENELVPAWWIRKNILSFVDQTLAKLKEEPEPTEFTKNILANLERWDLLPKEKDCRIKTIIAWLKELCRRYDWLVKTISQLRRQKTSIISQLNQQIVQLQAENNKLVEGQQAK